MVDGPDGEVHACDANGNVTNDTVVARHERLNAKVQTFNGWLHYVLLVQCKPGALGHDAPFNDPPALQRRSLLQEPGGDRVMARM